MSDRSSWSSQRAPLGFRYSNWVRSITSFVDWAKYLWRNGKKMSGICVGSSRTGKILHLTLCETFSATLNFPLLWIFLGTTFSALLASLLLHHLTLHTLPTVIRLNPTSWVTVQSVGYKNGLLHKGQWAGATARQAMQGPPWPMA